MQKLKKKLKNIATAIAIGLNKSNNLLVSSDLEKNTETSSDKINPIYHKNSFLRAIQQGQLKEEQIQAYYKQLEVMDFVHGKTKAFNEDGTPKMREVTVYNEVTKNFEQQLIPWQDAMSFEELQKQSDTKQKLGDQIEGYITVLFLSNKELLEKDASFKDILQFGNSNLKQFEDKMKDLVKTKPTLKINREEGFYGAIKIEEYCNDVFVKIKDKQDFEKDKTCICEFYCVNYNKKKNEQDVLDGMDLLDYEVHKEDAFTRINQDFNLNNFIRFTSFDMIETKATKNDIIHNFKVEAFKEIKKLDKGFVVKFECVKI